MNAEQKHHMQQAARASAVKMLRERFQKAPCDSDGVSACVRCNVIFLTYEVDACVKDYGVGCTCGKCEGSSGRHAEVQK